LIRIERFSYGCSVYLKTACVEGDALLFAGHHFLFYILFTGRHGFFSDAFTSPWGEFSPTAALLPLAKIMGCLFLNIKPARP